MSNYLAIATVTEVLRQNLQQACQRHIDGINVLAERPSQPANDQQSTIHLFLYRVTPNAAWRNADLPTRGSDGRQIAQRPQAALDLHYLLSFYGDERKLVPQRLLGLAVAELHTNAILSQKNIRDQTKNVEHLADTDLADSVERVKIVPGVLNLDELSKLWSIFFQTPYALSITYEATVVLIEREVPIRAALPVRERGLTGLSMSRPLISAVRSIERQDGIVVGGLPLEIVGQRLLGEAAAVSFDGGEPLPLAAATDALLTVSADSLTALSAGAHGVQVIHKLPLGRPSDPYRAVGSEVLPFVLRPTITRLEVANGKLTIMVMPPIGKGQRASALLNEFDPPADREAHALSFDLPPRQPPPPGEPDADAAVTFNLVGVEPGRYLVRLQVDGAESLVIRGHDPDRPYDPNAGDAALDPNSQLPYRYIQPNVSIT
ncbi:DUF4255 domain-containing protein [Candidatus Chloroploca sp. M-50]|uniref:DUF4255 domain-containing protein n=1 Tax=Candidatus Chloroploca mongolica TaxID=2528176 RepID=A0ABS4DFX4_9CHLR|nr:DUF4255 domain-containing protein [Candidatus Chloroploca mongolica]MBP1468350.1 DUF4255 domain-containing protein [Candidatus Chloroploca mongolica]